MISPYTPPNTPLICIDTSPSTDGIKQFPNGGLVQGRLYHLDLIFWVPSEIGQFQCTLKELEREGGVGWNLCRFKIAQLPKSLTSLQTQRPLLLPAPQPESLP